MQQKQKKKKIYIYGKHVISEALTHAPKTLYKVFYDQEMKDPNLLALMAHTRVPCVPTKNIGRYVDKDAVHQGVIGVLNTNSLLVSLSSFLETLDTSTNPAIIMLDEIQDPHNVGAIIRSASAFGIAGVLIPDRRQVGITGVVAKSSAGMIFRIPLISIGNVNQTIPILKKAGFWIYGLVANGSSPLQNERFNAPSCFILGNEGSGVRSQTRTLCDILLTIQTHQRCESLNVTAAAAITCYALRSEYAKMPSAHQELPAHTNEDAS